MGVRSILSVTVPATSFDLTTLLDVLADMNLNSVDAPTKTYLRRNITQCSAAAAQYCNRVFLAQTYSESLYPDRDPYPYQIQGGLDVLQLSRWPITSVTDVTENGTALVEDADFKTDKDDGQLLRLDSNGLVRKWCTLPIVVVYAAGYAATAIPADLQDAVNRMVKSRYMARGRDPFVRQETVDGVGSNTYYVSASAEGNLTPDIADILDNYRVPAIA